MEPITTELRKLMTYTVDGFDLHRPLVECDRAEFERLCDQIDAVHEGLERENDRLKVELDRVLGELDEVHKSGDSMHSGSYSIGSATIAITPTLDWSGVAAELRGIAASLDGGAVMSITDELREWISSVTWLNDGIHHTCDKITAIADRIDAEHERAMAAAALIAGVPMTDENMAELGWVRKDKEHIISHATVEVTPHIDWSRMADELNEFVEIVRGMAGGAE